MMNDHAWKQIHAQREGELRARARYRGGDATPTGGARVPARRLLTRWWLGLWASRQVPAPRPVTAAVPETTAARRRTASDSPTTAAGAWARLATGAGSLDPADPSTTESGREAA